ncbi:MAG: TIGR00730 family Rossman fold protein [Prevotellaceae bacterium]|nr:TIGR00730 family Rossman fold protein [Prevotellaceae bacterium]MCD8304348.1 TIGR00730 family Rossman fold protein [Prevotellaceae bacterium]
MGEVRKVAIYCASSTQLRERYYEDAREVGRLLAERGATLINGAGNMGLMRASSDGCLEAGGKVIGIIPSFMVRQGWQYDDLTELIEVADMSTRKNMIADLSDASLVLPGGCGTLDEMFELMTNKQLGLYLKPIVVLNTLGYFDHLLAHLQRSVEEHFMRSVHAQMWTVAQTPEEAVKAVFETPEWSADVRRFAKI